MTQAEKLVKIIMPDLLRYLKLKERGLVCQNRVLQQIPLERREEKEEEFEEINQKVTKNI
ncbi:MAG: hypothetical protein SPL08_03815 [Pseudomonadota bacterium]|nr:hypothetical protein [Pseudomonadota bacterium]